MSDPQGRYPGYDVLEKRLGMSWDDVTREVVARRLAVPREPRALDATEFATLVAVCDRILPQPPYREAVPLAAYVDEKLHLNALDGYRNAALPPLREAWKRGLAGLDAAARAAHGRGFVDLAPDEQDAVLREAEAGKLEGEAWGDMPSRLFFTERVLSDVVSAYYAHPIAWSEIGYGGPASPRGYVRLDLGRRDPWEAAEYRPGDGAAGDERRVRRENARVR